MRVYFNVGFDTGVGVADYDAESDSVKMIGVESSVKEEVTNGATISHVRTNIGGQMVSVYSSSGDNTPPEEFAQNVLNSYGIEPLPEYMAMVVQLKKAGEILRMHLPYGVEKANTITPLKRDGQTTSRVEVRRLVDELSASVQNINEQIAHSHKRAAEQALLLQEAREYLESLTGSPDPSLTDKHIAGVEEFIRMRAEILEALPDRYPTISTPEDTRGRGWRIEWITPPCRMSDGSCTVSVPSQEVSLTVRGGEGTLRDYFYAKVFGSASNSDAHVRLCAWIEKHGRYLPATPHISLDPPYTACLADTASQLQAAWDEGRYYDLVALAEAWLRTYDAEGGPHYNLPRWAGMLILPVDGDYPRREYMDGYEYMWGEE